MDGLIRALAAARRERGISQAELAAPLSLSVVAVADWENGRDTPPCGHFLAWACALSLAVLLTDEAGEVRIVIKPPRRSRVSGMKAYRVLAAHAIAYAIEQPPGIDVGEIVIRPTAQG